MKRESKKSGLLNMLGLGLAVAGVYAINHLTPSFSESPNLAQNTPTQTTKRYVTSQEGINLIKQFEGYSDKVYLDAVGKPTIGYGHLITNGERYNTISPMEAEQLLRKDLRNAEKAVDELVKVELTDNQYSALVSFVYNLGKGNLAKSTLLRKLNAGDSSGAANEFLRWDKAGGKTLKGLTKRRNQERELFMKK